MNDKSLYYFKIIIPIPIIFGLEKLGVIESGMFVCSWLFYLAIYRTYIDGKKLYDKKVILKKDIWKLIIPGQRIKYFQELYLS